MRRQINHFFRKRFFKTPNRRDVLKSLFLPLMGRILSIDYGAKRCGLAITDPTRLIASGLATVDTSRLVSYLESYCKTEPVERFVIGLPKRLSGEMADIETHIQKLIHTLSARWPDIPISRIDERFTSKIASQYLSQSGLKKKDRQKKALIDEISAVIILQTYLTSEPDSRL